MKLTEKLAVEKIKEENLQLRDTIKRISVELDQKNSELEIEVAIERVRARSMAMQSSDELVEASDVMYDELNKLDINTLRIGICTMDAKTDAAEIWSRSEINKQGGNHILGVVPKGAHPVFDNMVKAWKANKPYYSNTRTGNEVKEYYEKLAEHLSYPLSKKYNECETITTFFFREGSLNVVSLAPLQKADCKIMIRFANVFGQIYQRFLDLQKAEAQAKEAQIQLALERVRARTMAMHKSSELSDAAGVLFQQFVELGITPKRCIIGIIDKDKKSEEIYLTTNEGKVVPSSNSIPMMEQEYLKKIFIAWKNKKEHLCFIFQGKKRVDWTTFLMNKAKMSLPEYTSEKIDPEQIQNEPAVFNIFFFSQGHIGLHTVEEISVTEIAILKRFASVFEQTYTRFLDLQKAEAQAREAQIETALERVRSRSMAMHKSSELLDVITVVSEQLRQLELRFDSVSFAINNDDKAYKFWVSARGLPHPVFLNVPYIDIPMFMQLQAAQKQGLKFHTDVLSQKENKKWQEHMFKQVNDNLFSDEAKEYVISRGLARSVAIFPNIMLVLANFASVPYSESDNNIVTRFGQVFDQTYTRFLDLQKAEAQAREAQIETALERVRSRSMAMHKSDELLEVISVVSEQLQQLNFRFNHVSFANNDLDQDYKFWVSAIGIPHPMRFNVPYLEISVMNNLREAQHKGIKFYTDILTKQENRQWHKHLLKHGGAKAFTKEVNEYSMSRGMARSITINPNIMLILANYASIPYSEEENKIIGRFGHVFEQAYTRFLDLQRAEEQAIRAKRDLEAIKIARKKAEKALKELKATQSQLIQSEKMASLGELTAGIAHEIQNPLNFVNNFSEVSNELIKEIQDIRHKTQDESDITEEDELLNDIAGNLEKILHHGKRAGDIVKGMLQHSRAGSGQKEPTNINALADEYLRLAYHGLRAKDKSFNATMNTEFDESLETMNIIPQDIGRVILNLITNAFYAVSTEALAKADSEYTPTVSLSTKKQGDKVLIAVKDNGNGIPEQVRDKIFQPFFTTKPTGSGTGLGLSLSYDIVKAHGGELRVETKEGEGSTFIIQLPILS